MRFVEADITINTKPENVIAAFVDDVMLNGWWGVERTLIDLRPGGPYTLAWQISEAGIRYVSSGIIEKYDPAGELIINNIVYLNPDHPFLGPMHLSIRAKAQNAHTHLTIRQDGYQEGEKWDWYYAAVKAAWPIALDTLKKYLE